MCEHSVKFFFGYSQSFPVSAVHNQNDDLKGK